MKRLLCLAQEYRNFLIKRYREARPRYSTKTGRLNKITNELCERIDQAYTANPELSPPEVQNIVLRVNPGVRWPE